MNLKRLLKHLFASRTQMRRHFPPSLLAEIKDAIAQAERTHRGEIRFVIEAALDPLQVGADLSPRERALEVFSELRIWDTQDNSGVLIYLLCADRAIEIVADRGIHALAGCGVWPQIAAEMQTAFSAGDYRRGAMNGIQAVAAQLQRHLPSHRAGELPDDVVML